MSFSTKIVSILILITLSSITFGQDTIPTLKTLEDSIVETAKSQLGVKYKWATSQENVSFDCSGFTSYVYKKNKINAPRISREYILLGEEVALNDCQKGDCIIFAGTKPGDKTPGHVGIILENNENGLKFIHCSSSKKHFGVVITDYFSSGYPKRFLSIRRLR